MFYLRTYDNRSCARPIKSLGGVAVKIARFSDLIAKCGRPQIHLSWVPPAADSTLLAAVKRHRVLTVHQRARGAKKDFAVVGLDEARDSQFLIFKKSLNQFAGRQIVGIRYDLLDEPLSVGPTPHGRTRKRVVGKPQKSKKEDDNVLPFIVPTSAASAETVRSTNRSEKSKRVPVGRVPRPPKVPVEKTPPPVLNEAAKREIQQAMGRARDG